MASVFWLRNEGSFHPVHRGDCVLGRSPACFLVLSSEKVSRQHAVVRLEHERLFIEDLGSRNGTFVNGERLDELAELEEGDTIEIGGHHVNVLLRETRDLPSTVDERDSDRGDTYASQQNVLELAEELVTHAAESDRRKEIARTIQRLIDMYLKDVSKRGSRLSGTESIRLVSVAKVIAGWASDDELAEWCASVVETAGQAPTHGPSRAP